MPENKQQKNEAQVRKKKPTLRDVSREAGVSVATVSRVLNDSPRVTPETRALIEDAIKRLGFTPSPMARALNTGRTQTIGALVPTLDHAIFAKFLESLEKRLAHHGFSLVVSTTDSNPETETQKARKLLGMGAEGLIVSGKKRGPDFDDLIARFDVPVVITSYFDSTARYPTIGYDNQTAAELAINYLRKLGHRHICVVHGPTADNDRTIARLRGVGLHADTLSITNLETTLDVIGGSRIAERIIQSGMEVSAILCLSDVLALGVLFAFQRLNISVPDDISVMGFDNLEWSPHSSPPLSTLNLPVDEMGSKSADALCGWLNDELPIKPALLATTLVERETVAHYPAKN